VQAHAVFAADLSLALPDGTTLDAITAATDTGVWQSAGRTINEIPHILARLQGRISEANERIATIDRELTRLEAWDGQAAYDAALSELSAINAAFAAAEEQAGAEPGASPAGPGRATQPGGEVAPEEAPLAELLVALAQEERAGDGWGEWQPVIPPAPASLAFMAAEAERRVLSHSSHLEPLRREMAELSVAIEAGSPHTTMTSAALFGDTRGQRRPQRPAISVAPHDEVEVTQLPLF
jgi:hypothetical protein